MTQGFQCWQDPWGDIFVRDGVVMQPRTGAIFHVGAGESMGGTLPDENGEYFRRIQAAQSGTFVGGSGRNLIATGVPARYSGADCPAGIYRHGEPDTFRLGIFTLGVTGSSAAVISDGTDDVAVLSSGGTAPVGNYASTTYGQTTYGEIVGGTPQTFTIAVSAESATPADLPGAMLTLSAGTAASGEFAAVDSQLWELVADTDWTIVVANDGSAELRYLSSVIATRTAGSAWSPGGTFDSTNDGSDDYNSGDPWMAHVALVHSGGLAGSVYLSIVETGGVVTAVSGPFFGSLPSPSGGTFYAAISEFDGSGAAEQILSGLLVWP